MAAMRVLTSPAETGAVTLALPQDVQAEAWDYPGELFQQRTWHIARPLADRTLLSSAVEWIRAAQAAFDHRRRRCDLQRSNRSLKTLLVEQTGIAVGETMAGKGALPWDHPQNLEAIGATGTLGANIIGA